MEEFKVPFIPLLTIKVTDPNRGDKNGNNNLKTKETETIEADKVATPELCRMCPYKVPSWSMLPPADCNYSFEVLKSGQIIEEIKDLQKKAFWTFGRFSENNIEMAHPTISRYHAILQYRPKPIANTEEVNEAKFHYLESNEKQQQDVQSTKEGWYVYDLGSTHGTFLNKQRIPSNVYIRVKVGHILRLGASTRCYILQGPVEDEEPESELTVTELKAKRQHEFNEAVADKQRKILEAEERARNEGCNWGMSEDADTETDLTHNPYAATNNEELFLDDPKKTLRGFFEREGLQLEYKCDEMSAGSFVCRVKLPVDDSNGRPIIAEVIHKGRKKQCVVQCALEACRILDRHGLLRQSNQEPQKRKIKSNSDSDDDEFLDRTGDIARKRQRKVAARCNVALSHDDLLKQEKNLKEQFAQVQANIMAYQDRQKRLKAQQGDKNDDLDSYMENLKDEEPQRVKIRKLRLEEQRIKIEQQRIQRLIKLTKPMEFSIVKPANGGTLSTSSTLDINKKQLPMIGKRNQFSKFKMISTAKRKADSNNIESLASDEEEMDEDEAQTSNGIIAKEQIITNKNKMQNANEATNKEILKMYTTANLPTTTSAEDKNGNEEMPLDNNNSLTNCVAEDNEIGKKRRQRIRHRGKRSEVDIDENDEHYDPTGKYAKWMPPENQCGDGFTKLNKKYGY